ncbi:DnaT-like ssDNA-binding protein [Lonepinella sp. BR2930]|uniref:DnaT-like ssDNA-binding protein n=1 Tax=Lonepinella sp. BR2930 TaxID=3434554 RepID=UPI003F6E0D71
MEALNVPNDSYVTVEDADQYHFLRASFEQWNELSDEMKARRLVSASDYLDVNYRFTGEPLDEQQPRAFPRKPSNVIPSNIKMAVFELALQTDLNQNPEQKMASVKVGSLEVDYQEDETASSPMNRFAYVKSLLEPYLDKRSGFGSVAMLRG